MPRRMRALVPRRTAPLATAAGIHRTTGGGVEVRGTVAPARGLRAGPVVPRREPCDDPGARAYGLARGGAAGPSDAAAPLQAHNGRLETARRLAGRNVRAFSGVDHVIANAAGCGAHMQMYGELIDGAELPVRDVIAFLHDEWGLGTIEDWVEHGARARRLPRCVSRAARAGDPRPAARRCWEGSRTLQVIEIPQGDRCCGAAGLYNVHGTRAGRASCNATTGRGGPFDGRARGSRARTPAARCRSRPGLRAPAAWTSRSCIPSSSLTARIATPSRDGSATCWYGRAMTYVGVGRRFVAIFIDSILLLILSGPFAEIRHGDGYLQIDWHRPPPVLAEPDRDLSTSCSWRASPGATIGKFLTGIRVVNQDGTKPTWSAAIVRNIARIVDAFPYVHPVPRRGDLRVGLAHPAAPGRSVGEHGRRHEASRCASHPCRVLREPPRTADGSMCRRRSRRALLPGLRRSRRRRRRYRRRQADDTLPLRVGGSQGFDHPCTPHRQRGSDVSSPATCFTVEARALRRSATQRPTCLPMRTR